LDSISLAGIQANSLLQSGRYSEADFAEVVVQSRKNAMSNSNAQLSGEVSAADLLKQPYIASPLHKHDCCPITDGASVLIIGEKSSLPCNGKRPVYIRGIDHRMEVHQLGLRELPNSSSTSLSLATARKQAGFGAADIDFAELYAAFSPQSLILKDALGLPEKVSINPSGGPLAGHIMMSAGLDRFGMAFRAINEGKGDRAIAHATSGPCLQHNLVSLVEGG
jgi:acetyl-CoA acetyltransferase